MEVSIAKIKPNPFQSRKTMDKGAIDRLAKEIDETGYWGSLRVRKKDDAYQLVFGHQRLQALKHLGRQTVTVEVAKLSDLEMAQQSLIENLQRHNLLEIDKAEAINQAFQMEKAHLGSQVSDREVIQRLTLLLGYTTDNTIYQFLSMARLKDDTKKAVRETNMPRGAVAAARGIGGETMVRHAAAHRISELDLKPMQKIVGSLPEPIRQKVVAAVVKDRVTKPDEVEKIARREQAKTVKKADIPPDLMLFIRKWTGDLHYWKRRIEAAAKHKTYIHAHPEVVTEFKGAAEEFIAALKALLDLR